MSWLLFNGVVDGPEAVSIRQIHVHFAFVKQHLDNIPFALFAGDVKLTKLQSDKDGWNRDRRIVGVQHGQSIRMIVAR